MFTYPTLSSILTVEIVGKLHVDRLQEMKMSLVRHIRVYLLGIFYSCIQLYELLSPSLSFIFYLYLDLYVLGDNQRQVSDLSRESNIFVSSSTPELRVRYEVGTVQHVLILFCLTLQCGASFVVPRPLSSLVCHVFLCFCHFPKWCSGSGMVLDCIDL